jgi:hypothetical protein
MATKPDTANHAGNSESLAGSVVLASALSPVFALLFVALRFYTARRILGTIRIDDCRHHAARFRAILTKLQGSSS